MIIPIHPSHLFLRSHSGSESPELQRISSLQKSLPLTEIVPTQSQRKLFHRPVTRMIDHHQKPLFRLDNLRKQSRNHSLMLAAVSTYQKPTHAYLDDAIKTAIENNQLHIVQNWIQTPNVDVDAMNYLGETALQIAARYNCFHITQLLLQNGANINAANETQGYPAIHSAIINHQKNMVVQLAQAGASLTIRNDANCTNAIDLSERHLNPSLTLWLKNLTASNFDSARIDQMPALIATSLRTNTPAVNIPLAKLPFQDFHQAEWLGCFSAAIATKKYDFAAILLAGGLPIAIDDLTPDIKKQLYQTFQAYKNQYTVMRTQFDKDIIYSIFECLEDLPLSMLRALLTYPSELLKKK
jgi:ankyrin repeat protein